MRAPIARCLLATLGILLVPASALAIPQVGEKSNGWNLTEEHGLRTYVQCWDKLGAECGRNIVDDGLANGKPPSESRIKEWTATMNRWLNPAPVPTAVDSPAIVASAPATTSVAPASGGYAIPEYIVQCESGGDYGASNPSGAYGAYQIMPGTAAAYGCDLSTPGGQDQCAGKIYAAEGASPWACG